MVFLALILLYFHTSLYDLTEMSQFMTYLTRFSPVTLVFIGRTPRFWIVYDNCSFSHYDLTVLVSSSQWYWSFRFLPTYIASFQSITTSSPSLSVNCLVLPFNCNVLLRFSSTDVIHSFGIPSSSLKVDCIPGSTFDTVIHLNTGLYYGNCYEFCGTNHAYIPFLVFSV